jgi:D-alanyl-D-alanine carboxypeptidase
VTRASVLVAAILALSVMSTVSAAAPAPLPAEGVARTFLDVFNRGDAASFRALMRDRWPHATQSPADFMAMRDQTGGFDLVKIEDASETTFRAVLKPHLADAFVELELRVDQSGTPAIQVLSLTPIRRPDDIPAPGRLPMAALQAAVHDRIAAMEDFSGVVLIARDARPVFTYAAGLADRQHNIPNRPDTRFRIASMGKMFTAVAIGQLMEAGKLRLDGRVGDYRRD